MTHGSSRRASYGRLAAAYTVEDMVEALVKVDL